MTIRLSTWAHPASGETRVYINGHNRSAESKLYLAEATGDRAGQTRGGSKDIDGNTYGKSKAQKYVRRDKDIAAITETLERFGWTRQTPFAEIVAAVEAGTYQEVIA